MKLAHTAAGATAVVAVCALVGCVVLASSGPLRSAVELASWGGQRVVGAGRRSSLLVGSTSDELGRLGANIAQGKVTSLFSQSLEEGCTSWRGCAATPRELVPAEVKFECGGDGAAETCVEVVKTCTASADADAQRLFETQPRVATELRAAHNCECFVSNGCKPSCNVAMYMIWSAGSNMRCASEPPIYLETSGAYQYGDPYSSRVLPSDLSFDYFPDYPNPAGHIMNVPSVRHRYAQDPKTDFEYPTYPRTAGYSGYEPSPYVDSVQPQGYANIGTAPGAGYGYAIAAHHDGYVSGWAADSRTAPDSIADPSGYWANHNINYRPYDSWTGEGKYYAPYSDAYYYYDPNSGHVYVQ